MDKLLTFVHPNELHDYWDEIKKGLEIVKQTSGNGWIPEDVYNEIRNNRSTLHLGDVNGEYAGFIVLSPQQDYDCGTLFIWICYSINPENDVVKIFLEDIKQMARKIKARNIKFMSARKGWERRLKDYGFEPVQTLFKLEV